MGVLRTAVAVAALAATALPQAHAAGVSGQGTWETTLQGRDLDGNAATFEGYYDTDLDITWLADANYAQTSGYDADGQLGWDEAKAWAAQLNVSGITGWRLPSLDLAASWFCVNNSCPDATGSNAPKSSELAHLFVKTLGTKLWVTQYIGGGYDVFSPVTNAGPFPLSTREAFWYGQDWSAAPWGARTDVASAFQIGLGLNGGGGAADVGYFKPGSASAWAVHSGDVGVAVTSVPEPETYTLALAGLAAAALMARKRRA